MKTIIMSTIVIKTGAVKKRDEADKKIGFIPLVVRCPSESRNKSPADSGQALGWPTQQARRLFF
tara:strand:+ start:524 stop:715 length:192 start_codon:yes stop_codon:yes gene_type:complete